MTVQIAVVGLGYVGLVTAACLARAGQDVIGIDNRSSLLNDLTVGRVPIHEPGLESLLADAVDEGRLRFESSARAAAVAHVVIVAVGTYDGAGGWQTETLESCLSDLVPHLAADAVLAIRSTIPPSFIGTVGAIVRRVRAATGRPALPVLLNPEFTSEGSAVQDFLAPDRVVIGVLEDPDGTGVARLRALYTGYGAPILVQAAADACLTKLASNLFLATKISFANELASLCELYDGAIDAVVDGMSYDSRIGGTFLRPGIGFGGSCLPHQVRNVVREGRAAGLPLPLLAAVNDVNDGQIEHVVRNLAVRLGDLDGARVALLGLAFKPGTDDVREAPALAIATALLELGATIVAYDPMKAARERAIRLEPRLLLADSATAALRGSAAAVVATEWPEFIEIDWATAAPTMNRRIVIDGRNALDRNRMVELGFDHVGFGLRRHSRPSEPQLLETIQRAPSVVDIASRSRTVDRAGLAVSETRTAV